MLIAVIGLAIIALSAVGNAVTLDRFGWRDEPRRSVEKLKGIPNKIGDWVGAETPADENLLAKAGAQGWLLRNYRNTFTNKEVSVMLLCGRPRLIAVHAPEVCYGGAGYRLDGEREVRTFSVTTNSAFFMAYFSKQEAVVADRLQIYWGWAMGGEGASGEWKAPKMPRVDFRRAPALYKLYVQRRVLEGEPAGAKDACAEFLDVFLPEVTKKLFAS
jgi:hypothetical protein